MTKKEIMIKAHQMTKEIKKEYSNVDYRFQLGLCLAYLYEEGECKMLELEGTEKQISWAEDIRNEIIKGCDASIEYREAIHKEKNKRFTLKRLNEALAVKQYFENKVSAKYFIENWSFLLKKDFIEDTKITSEGYELSYYICLSNKIMDFLRLNDELDMIFSSFDC